MSKGTDRRTVRVTPELWERAGRVAVSNDETLSDVMRRALEGYTKESRQPMTTNLAALADDLSTLYWQEVGADEQIDTELQARTVEAIGKLRDGDWWKIVTELWPYTDMGMPQMAALDCVLSWIEESPVLRNP